MLESVFKLRDMRIKFLAGRAQFLARSLAWNGDKRGALAQLILTSPEVERDALLTLGAVPYGTLQPGMMFVQATTLWIVREGGHNWPCARGMFIEKLAEPMEGDVLVLIMGARSAAEFKELLWTDEPYRTV